ncbi:hypothetical protein JGU66_27020 [Myxococcaceae bacterium JPH2]|nr:hypothetical protein [Myxococcaceae bacterium JPH2]
MGQRFYDLKIDVHVPGRWYLSEPTTASGLEVDDIWRFTRGRPVELDERLQFPLFRPGTPTDIEFAGAGQTPVVSDRVASIFRESAPRDVQLFPVEVEGTGEPYFLLNVARMVRAIDDAACKEVQRYAVDEPVQAHRAGQYRSVSGLRIDKSKVGDARVFRLWGFFPPIIVADEIKDALMAAGISGARFDEV